MIFVAQALVATKAVNEKARMAAYNLLVEIGHCCIRWHPESTQKGSHFLVFCKLFASARFLSAM